MKPLITGALVSVAALGLLSACSNNAQVTIGTNGSAPASVTAVTTSSPPAGATVPAGSLTIPPGAIPSDLSIPEQVIDQMMAQFEASGVKVDRACFTALLKDPTLRKLIEAGGTPSPEVISKFVSCITS